MAKQTKTANKIAKGINALTENEIFGLPVIDSSMKQPQESKIQLNNRWVLYSPGVDPSKIEKQLYRVDGGHYRCVHVGCDKILSRQFWRSHIEMNHINGRKVFKRKLPEN